MAQEREYRELLRKAQDSVEPIRDFLAAVKKAPFPKADARLSVLVEAAENHAKKLEHEIDEIWDLMKRSL
jgi:hypothetical protein